MKLRAKSFAFLQQNARIHCMLNLAKRAASTHAAVASERMPGHWRLWAELEKRDESLKLRMAQLLTDLHDLAAAGEQAPQKSKEQRRNAQGKMDNAARLLVKSRSSTESKFLKLPANIESMRPDDVRDTAAAFADDTLLRADCLRKLLEIGIGTFSMECTVVNLRERHHVQVVGDLHGSILCLQKVLRLVGTPSADNAVIFNGDFVDRGPHGTEVLATLLLLKIAHPNDVFLLRGNHEDGVLCTVYGFFEELREKYPDEVQDLWKAIIELFSTLPLCAVTPEAFVVHGGLPSKDTSIQKLQQMTLEQRKVPSVTRSLRAEDITWSPVYTPKALATIQGLLWADPTDKPDGISRNERRGSTMVKFGTDVAQDFLKTHNLKYLVRSHEARFEGWDAIDSGDGTFVYTVFSAANYPDDQGDNKGAVLKLCTGEYPKPLTFGRKRRDDTFADKQMSTAESSYQTLMELVLAHKNRLRIAFERLDVVGSGRVTVEQWVEVMQTVLDLDLDWKSLQPVLVGTTHRFPASTDAAEPVTAGVDTGLIDFARFLRQQQLMHQTWDSRTSDFSGVLEALYRNHEELRVVFHFLDTDGNGVLSFEEFTAGVKLLNDRLPQDDHITDVDTLFNALDIDGSGQIDLDEFCEVFKVQDRQ